MSVYDYSVKDAKGNDVSLKDYEGKVLLIVNTATGCGFTPQYKDLEELYEKYHGRGLEILDIPCNQFRGQAPGTDEEIHQFCTLTYHTQFPQMHKSEVNGENELPLYTYLKSQKSFEGFGDGPMAPLMNDLLQSIDKDYQSNPAIKWNFTKFLVSRSGSIIARFEPTFDMKEVAVQVEAAL
ncbi:MAG: glutathione peroxidase [Lachnospiraceae bacterium]|jgi:glutathione peroxidase|nr:glutathione peroxidase [Lachnospiraceae bacterium]MCI1726992.1 glutathione peroxidase [Lachnospiraceae bacterium]